MTLIRFMRERARQIVFDQDPGFKVMSYEQIELERGVYRCRTMIHELSTGKFFSSYFRISTKYSWKKNLKPFDCDEPVFREVEMNEKFRLLR